MIALLAEQAAAAAEPLAVPAWVAGAVGLLSVLGGASWPKVQAWARGAKKVVASAESILDLVDGEDPPEERRATFAAFLAAHGRDPEFLAALSANGVAGIKSAAALVKATPVAERPPAAPDATFFDGLDRTAQKPPEVKP